MIPLSFVLLNPKGFKMKNVTISRSKYFLFEKLLFIMFFEIQVQDGFEDVATELAKSKHALIWAQRKENESSSLIKDLTSMVKEQKTKLSEVCKLKQEAAANLQAGICSVLSLGAFTSSHV